MEMRTKDFVGTRVTLQPSPYVPGRGRGQNRSFQVRDEPRKVYAYLKFALGKYSDLEGEFLRWATEHGEVPMPVEGVCDDDEEGAVAERLRRT